VRRVNRVVAIRGVVDAHNAHAASAWPIGRVVSLVWMASISCLTVAESLVSPTSLAMLQMMTLG
jgi:hypothetical protein